MQLVSLKQNPAGIDRVYKKHAAIVDGLYMAPVRGFEPLTHRLTVDCATIAPHRNGVEFVLKALKSSPVLPYCQ